MEEAVRPLFVVANEELVTLRFEPRAKAELHRETDQYTMIVHLRANTCLVLNGTKQARLLLSSIAALVEDRNNLQTPGLLLAECIGRCVAEASESGCASSSEHGV